ncbi:transmembrane protein, putative [Medicago truncatula]|uniref:Transmembrane protein, putative n=1 Tax=Medicago truncatula TaxID=3880 RepID=G7JB92_MEDTR|nr:transmembrane protein, putative [Medicago truncatula]
MIVSIYDEFVLVPFFASHVVNFLVGLGLEFVLLPFSKQFFYEGLSYIRTERVIFLWVLLTIVSEQWLRKPKVACLH